jgi:hypothetical protein
MAFRDRRACPGHRLFRSADLRRGRRQSARSALFVQYFICGQALIPHQRGIGCMLSHDKLSRDDFARHAAVRNLTSKEKLPPSLASALNKNK